MPLAQTSNDANLLHKYKLGYSECVQECLRFMNQTNNVQTATNNIDPETRQRLVANLMRQFNSLEHKQEPSSPLSCLSNDSSFRRSSVSPISSSSSSSSSSYNTSYLIQNQELMDNEQSLSPVDSNSGNDGCWRPW